MESEHEFQAIFIELILANLQYKHLINKLRCAKQSHIQKTLHKIKEKHKPHIFLNNPPKVNSINTMNLVYAILPMEEYQKNTLITGHPDGAIHFWNLSTQTILKTFKGHTTFIEDLVELKSLGIAFFASAGGSANAQIIVWNIDQNSPVKVFYPPIDTLCIAQGVMIDSEECIRKFKFHLVSGHKESAIMFWDAINGEEYIPSYQIKDFKYTGSVNKILVHHEKKSQCTQNLLIYGTYKGVIRIINLNNKSARTINGHVNIIYSLVLIKDRTLASSSLDRWVKIWDYKTGECLNSMRLEPHIFSMTCMHEYINDWILVGGSEQYIYIIDIKTGHVEKIKTEFQIYKLYFLKLSNEFSFVSVGSSCDNIQLWE